MCTLSINYEAPHTNFKIRWCIDGYLFFSPLSFCFAVPSIKLRRVLSSFAASLHLVKPRCLTASRHHVRLSFAASHHAQPYGSTAAKLAAASTPRTSTPPLLSCPTWKLGVKEGGLEVVDVGVEGLEVVDDEDEDRVVGLAMGELGGAGGGSGGG